MARLKAARGKITDLKKIMNANSTKARLSASRTSQPEHPPATTLPPGDLGVEPYINKKEVARRLGRTPRGVDKMMQRGQRRGRKC